MVPHIRPAEKTTQAAESNTQAAERNMNHSRKALLWLCHLSEALVGTSRRRQRWACCRPARGLCARASCPHTPHTASAQPSGPTATPGNPSNKHTHQRRAVQSEEAVTR